MHQSGSSPPEALSCSHTWFRSVPRPIKVDTVSLIGFCEAIGAFGGSSVVDISPPGTVLIINARRR